MLVDRWTKALLIVIAACLVFLCVRTPQEPRTTVHGAGGALQFSADKDHFYFFDPGSQKVYTYPVIGGHTQGVVGFSQLGGELLVGRSGLTKALSAPRFVGMIRRRLAS